MADAKTHRPPDEVRRDIEHTLSQMDETVDALADRLSPEHLIDQAWGRLRGGADEGIGRVVREHPIPVALVGVGLGWLAVEQATGSDSHEGNGGGGGDGAPGETLPTREHRGRIEDRYSPAVVTEEDEPGLGERVSDATSSARERAKAKASEVGDRAREMKERASEAVSAASSEVEARARRTGDRARRGFWELLEENPLALGAVAFGVGLASGISVPSSEAEDRLMGRASDTLEAEAKRIGRETAEKTKHVAKDAATAAAREADRAIDAAAEAAERRAEAEGLTSEHLREEARAARDRTVEQAKADAERLRRRPSEG
jgi:hypothetical protein